MHPAPQAILSPKLLFLLLMAAILCYSLPTLVLSQKAINKIIGINITFSDLKIKSTPRQGSCWQRLLILIDKIQIDAFRLSIFVVLTLSFKELPFVLCKSEIWKKGRFVLDIHQVNFPREYWLGLSFWMSATGPSLPQLSSPTSHWSQQFDDLGQYVTGFKKPDC